ncbi:MAG: TIGR00289 family protein [Candidatus Freyarchaeota archaeon]
MNVAVLFSGGKDSSYVIQWCIERSYNIKALVSIFPQRSDSYMYHVPNVELTELQAKAADLPHITRYSSGVKEEEIGDLVSVLQTLDIDGIVSGAVASEYQRSRLDLVSKKLGLSNITPLWHRNPIMMIESMIRLNFNIIFSGVYALGFNKNWLGRRLDEAVLRELIELNKRYGIDLAGEGGEYETLVLDAPFFKKTIKIVKSEKIWEGDGGYLDVQRAKLVEKSKKL